MSVAQYCDIEVFQNSLFLKPVLGEVLRKGKRKLAPLTLGPGVEAQQAGTGCTGTELTEIRTRMANKARLASMWQIIEIVSRRSRCVLIAWQTQLHLLESLPLA